jgi:Mrp family chromosome partitioning ATPase
MSATDGGRLVTALAAGGSVLLLSATVVALWPRTYGTAATFVLDSGSRVSNPVALAGRIEASLLEREELATIAMDLPPELRSPDPIGRLRAGIRVQSRGALGFTVEFRGSDPQSVQRIANHLVERAVQLTPKLATSPIDNAPALLLAERSRAVTEFLTAHPEITLEPNGGKPSPAGDSGLDALRSEKRQIEQRLASGASDNPYADLGQSPEVLSLRLAEIKTTITRREAALKQPHAAAPPAVAPELTSQWRALLADLASAQAAAVVPAPPPVSGHVTARAPLPSTPLTPNRLVLSIVAALLSAAAAMIAYVLPRRAPPIKRQTPRSAPPGPRSDAPPPQPSAQRSDRPGPPGVAPSEPPLARTDPLPQRSDAPPLARTDPLPQRNDAPPPGRPRSDPPGPIAVQRTVVLSGNAGSPSGTPPAVAARRTQTTPGGAQAPGDTALPDAALAPPPGAHSPPAAPLFGSRPPPGAGSYSVSSSHPPAMGPSAGARTSVERLSPLQSARPPAPAAGRRSSTPSGGADSPLIVSRPPALDPEAETWAARFETVPPPAPPAEEPPRKRSGRWKTQVMGSMVPLEVSQAREERPPLSEPDSFQPLAAPAPRVPAAEAVTLVHHEVHGWGPKPVPAGLDVTALCDAVLEQLSSRRVSLAVTGAPGPQRSQVAAALAVVLAQGGARVLLVEADFDHPELHQALGVSAPPGAGFSQQLRARAADGAPQPWTVARCTPNLNVLVEGRLRSPGQLAPGVLRNALDELRGQHHALIIHAPSLDKTSELRQLATVTYGAVLAHPAQPPSVQFGEGALVALL